MPAATGECDSDCTAETTGEDVADDAAEPAVPGGVTPALVLPSRRSCSFLVNSLVMELKKLSTLRLVPAAAAALGAK